MKIKRGGMAEPINAKTTTNPLPKYCPHCEKKGVRDNDTILKQRLDYFLGDRDDWLQCYHCGNVFLDDRVRQEGKLRTDLEITKQGRPTDTEHYQPPKHRRGFNERLSNEPEIRDPEVRKELKKGHKLLNYSER